MASDTLTRLANAYHVTDLSNLAKIIKDGAIYSRGMLATLDRQFHNSAQSSVLNRRNQKQINDGGRSYSVSLEFYVPLYFRARSPMLYRVEGIKLVPDSWPHMPRPVLFEFVTKEIMTNDSMIADGNASDHETTIVRGPAGLDGLSPEIILYPGGTGNSSEVNRKRQAELLVPISIGVDRINALLFRTPAELRAAEELLWMAEVSWDSVPAMQVRPDLFNEPRCRLFGYGFSNEILDRTASFDQMAQALEGTSRADTYYRGRLWYGFYVQRAKHAPSEKLTAEFITDSGATLHTFETGPSDSAWTSYIGHGSFDLTTECIVIVKLAGVEVAREQIVIDEGDDVSF